MRNRVLYLNPDKVEKALDHLARDLMRIKRFFTDKVKFVRDYRTFRRQGFTRKAALFNARNAL